MPEKKIRLINYILIAIMLGMLMVLSILPSVQEAAFFSFIPILFLVAFLILVTVYRKYHQQLPAEISREGFLYTILGILCCILVSSSALLISTESFHIDNTLEGLNMLRLSMLVGAPIGVMTWVWLSKLFGIKHIIFLKVFMITFALYFATLVSHINRSTADQETITLSAGITNKEKNNGSIATYLLSKEPLPYIYIPYEEDIERLCVPQKIWDPLYKNADVSLNLRRGYFGYLYVESLNGQRLL